MTYKARVTVVSIMAILMSALLGALLAVGTVDSWYSAPPSDDVIDLHRRVNAWCKPVPIRVLECGSRWDACICQSIQELSGS
jgi:hypothetical protein